MIDAERIFEMDFLRATEGAAIVAHRWMGRGEKEAADAAACDAIRGMFDLMDMRGEVVIGEGIKDEAPGIFKGEKVGTWEEGAPQFHIALDPVDGTTNVSKGMANSVSCIAAAIPVDGEASALEDIPAFYLEKLSYPEKVRKAFIADPKLPISVEAPTEEVIKLTAKILEKDIRDIVVMILDRPRNQPYIDAVRRMGAKLRMISDGDIAAAIAPALPESNVDLYVGIGGAPEGVLSAAGLRCLGGGLQAKIWPKDGLERRVLIAEGHEKLLDRVYLSKDLAKGDRILFSATGISDSSLLRGVRVDGKIARTHSVLMRVKSRTVRSIKASHDLSAKTFRLRSANAEVLLVD
ncbi:class II fructose-bisphosphatase [Haloferula sp. BvORR071]|uniref:class II fructose-bisphosphatase n=1 Tax=Haloferula sp. BvORR071 TaxID=1396141 RepID=UPI000555A9CF|nr:class II fructose-bisphosphatase [Haloferula sp. BvORR071]